MKSASESVAKYVNRAGAASLDYKQGAEQTSKDQAQAAIAGKDNYVKGVQESITRGAYEKGLAKSGKSGWLKGVQEKGANRYADGVSSGADKYATNSAKFDSARNAASNMPRGPKGSENNYARAKTVGQALRAVKVGK
jgi:hypothetical protein